MRKTGLIMLGAVCWLAGATGLRAATFQENFASDPLQHGWKIFGDTSLFHWNSTNQNLEVTWSSTNRNSYFYHPLGTIVATNDDFGFAFDLRLSDASAVNLFELAAGMLNVRRATQTNFYRGVYDGPVDLIEFDFFPDTGWGATISTTSVDTNHNWAYAYIMQDLTPNVLFRITMNYVAAEKAIYTTVTNSEFYGSSTNRLGAGFQDFRMDAFSISSYSGEGQDPSWPGSIIAHGIIDNVVVTAPDPLVLPLTARNDGREVQFSSRTNWFYRLEGTSDFQNWTEVASGPGTGGVMTLSDPNPMTYRFYRVAADRP